MKISPARVLEGTVRLPGDKSISHRAAMLASIADGNTRIDNFASSADCQSTIECMRGLGVKIERDGSHVAVEGVGKFGLWEPDAPLDCGNSGTTMRLISGILAGQKFESILTGDDSLRSRPMKRVIEPLGLMGSMIYSDEGRAPLNVSGLQPLGPIVYKTPVASAQIKSCVLLAGLYADGRTTVLETVPTRDHTERMLRWFGVEVKEEDSDAGRLISLEGDSVLTARDLTVPSDISSAAFFMIAAACLPGSRVTLPNVGLNPARRGVLDVLVRLGANVGIGEQNEACNEPSATLTVVGGLTERRGANRLGGEIIPNIIDEIPILAILGTQLAGGLEIRDAAELRVKESDRISAVADNLKKMGATVVEFPDGLRVEKSKLTGAEIDPRGDHRISMAFAVAGLLAEGETTINGAECADVSFPGFFETLSSVVM
jgi:3-phosphoshikimate 1-carboxyvinyltransferase